MLGLCGKRTRFEGGLGFAPDFRGALSGTICCSSFDPWTVRCIVDTHDRSETAVLPSPSERRTWLLAAASARLLECSSLLTAGGTGPDHHGNLLCTPHGTGQFHRILGIWARNANKLSRAQRVYFSGRSRASVFIAYGPGVARQPRTYPKKVVRALWRVRAGS